MPLGHCADPVHAGEGGNTCRKAAAETTDKGYKPGKRKFSFLFKTTWVFPLDLAAEQHRCSEGWEGVRAAPFWCAVFFGVQGDPGSTPQSQCQGTGPRSTSPPFRQASQRAAGPPGAQREQELGRMLRITKPNVWDVSTCSLQRAMCAGRTTLPGDTGVVPGAGGIPKIPLLSRAGGGSGGVTVLPGRRYPAGQRLRGCSRPARARLEQRFVPAQGQRGGETLPGGVRVRWGQVAPISHHG